MAGPQPLETWDVLGRQQRTPQDSSRGMTQRTAAHTLGVTIRNSEEDSAKASRPVPTTRRVRRRGDSGSIRAPTGVHRIGHSRAHQVKSSKPIRSYQHSTGRRNANSTWYMIQATIAWAPAVGAGAWSRIVMVSSRMIR